MYNFFTLSTLFAAMAVGRALPREVIGEFPSLTAHRERRVAYGDVTNIESVPYQVSLCETLLDGTQLRHCSGMIISKDWVLTAAHCIDQSEPHAYHIVSGSNNACTEGSFHELSVAIPHEDFHRLNDPVRTFAVLNDIALLKLKEPIEFDSVRQPVGLYNQNEEITPGSIGTVSGWGYIDENRDHLSEIILSGIVQVTDTNECLTQFYPGLVLPGELCTLPKFNQDACAGDSGGPLIVNGRLAGIISWGEQCTRSPGFYAAISFYRDWINRISNV